MSRALRMVLTLPVLRIGVGPFAIDPLEHLVGARVTDLLQPLMTGPRTERRTGTGVRVDVYPLALPDGEGATLPLGAWGELGIFNDRGLIVLSVPAVTAAWVVTRLGDAIVRGPEAIPTPAGRGRAVSMWAQLRPGARAAFPLGTFGEVGVEAV